MVQEVDLIKKEENMKKIIGLTLCMVFAFVSISYGALDKNEEDYVKALVALKTLVAERDTLTEARDAEIAVENDASQVKKEAITTTYKTQIDSKQVEINAKQNDLDSIISIP